MALGVMPEDEQRAGWKPQMTIHQILRLLKDWQSKLEPESERTFLFYFQDFQTLLAYLLYCLLTLTTFFTSDPFFQRVVYSKLKYCISKD